MKVKICGLKTEETLNAAVSAGADFIGFIFFEKSPRHVSLEQARALRKLAKEVPVVAVTVNADDEALDAITATVKPDMLQLHGTESPARVQQVKARYGLPVIKAIPVDNESDLMQFVAYDTIADMLMFDAKAPIGSAVPGGHGISFDWKLLRGLKLRKPWFLSGGLTVANVGKAIRIAGAPMVDVSSGVEAAPGVKDAELIRQFIHEAKHV